MKLPSYLTTVTPFSKALALFLFTTLPVFTFTLGLQAATQQSESLIVQKAATPTRTNTSTTSSSTTEALTKVVNEKQNTYFAENVLPNYPDIKDQLRGQEITQTMTFQLKNTSATSSTAGAQAWVVEAKDTNANLSHFLLTPTIQKELTIGSGNMCAWNDIRVIGQEENGIKLQEPQGYIVLSGNCDGYGAHAFTAIYKIVNGENIPLAVKSEPIPLQQIPFGTEAPTKIEFTDGGDALGKMRGVFGEKRPILVVEYPSDDVQKIESIAFFDLQTGKLVDLKRFK